MNDRSNIPARTGSEKDPYEPARLTKREEAERWAADERDRARRLARLDRQFTRDEP